MTKDLIERFAIWKAWEGRCYWCRELIVFKNVQKDHFFPRSMVGDAVDLESLREDYGLPSDFTLECYENWVPACPSCNTEKGARVIEPTPKTLLYIPVVVMKAKIARSIASKFEEDVKKAPLLALVASALHGGELQREDIEELFRDLPVYVRKAEGVPDDVLLIAPGWEVVERNGHVVELRGPRGFATTNLDPNADPSWLCPRCLKRGPWKGNICMNCGEHDYPH